MSPDVITPAPLDILLLLTSIPFLLMAIGLTVASVRTYARAGNNGERRRDKRADGLVHLLAAGALLMVAVAFEVRPLAEIYPDVVGYMERIVGPAARVVCTIIAGVLLWHEVRG